MKIVTYARVSTMGQADGGVSLEAQTAKMRAYAQAMDLQIVAELQDAGASAKSLERVGLKAVLAMLDAGVVQGVLVAKLDRLTRSVRDLGELVERYFADGTFALFSLADSINTTTAGGRLVLNVLGSVAQWEREAVAERTRDALGHLREHGVRLGRAPLGYTHAHTDAQTGRRVLRVDPDELATVERIKELRRCGYTLQAICSALEAEGRRTKRGGRWAPKTVRAVILRDGAAPAGREAATQ